MPRSVRSVAIAALAVGGLAAFAVAAPLKLDLGSLAIGESMAVAHPGSGGSDGQGGSGGHDGDGGGGGRSGDSGGGGSNNGHGGHGDARDANGDANRF